MMQEVARLLSIGKLKAVIAKTFPLEEAAYVTCLQCLHACIDSVELTRADTCASLACSTLQRLPASVIAVAPLNGMLHVMSVLQGRT